MIATSVEIDIEIAAYDNMTVTVLTNYFFGLIVKKLLQQLFRIQDGGRRHIEFC